MMNCPKCQTDFSGELDRCPLCGSFLGGDPSHSPFPMNRIQRPAKTARIVLGVITLLAIIALFMLAFLEKATWWGASMSSIALVLNFIFIRNVIAHSPDFIRIVERYFLLALAIAVLLWLYNGFDPIASQVIPGICAAALITNSVLVIIFKDAFIHDYGKYVLYSLVMGLFPLILALLGWIDWPWGAYACAAITAILVVILVATVREQSVAELKKLFNS